MSLKFASNLRSVRHLVYRPMPLKYQYSGIQKADTRKSVSKFSDESPSEELVLRRSTRVKKLPDRY